MIRDHTYRPDIDGLRALAVVVVIIFHASHDLLPGGFVGVDVFFVISGYLITSIILREIDAGTFTLAGFYARRCRRILPALVVVLSATWAIGRVALAEADFQMVGKHILGGSTFTSNILLWRETGYFDIAAIRKPLLHLWSLGVEEQFYLVWPPLAMLAVVWRGRPLALSFVLLTASIALAAGLPPSQGDATFYLLPTRMWELLTGAVLLQMQPWVAASIARGSIRREATAIAGLLLIGVVCFFEPGTGRARIAWLAAPVAGAALVIAARDAWVNRRLLSNPGVVLIGLISYPLYLWHWPLLSMVTLLAGQTPMQQLQRLKYGAVALAFLLAWLTWRLVERPVRRLATQTAERPRRNQHVLAFSAVVLIVFSTVGWTSWHRGRVHDVVAIAADEPLLDGAALFPGTDYHRVSTANAVLLLVGDSHSNHLVPGLVPEARAHGFGVSHVGWAGCLGVPLAVRLWGSAELFKDCQATIASSSARFLDDPRVKIVLFAARAGMYSVGTDRSDAVAEGGFVKMPTDARSRVLYDGYSATMRRLEASGRRIALMLDVPELDFEPHYCVARLASATFMGNLCAIARHTVDERQAAYRDVISRLQREHPQLAVFDPVPLFCDTAWCYARRNGRMMYRDPNHLSPDGSAFIAEALGRVLFQ